jgi:hypothetical protein
MLSDGNRPAVEYGLSLSVSGRLRRFEAYVLDAVDVLADRRSVTVWVRAVEVPAVIGCLALGKALAARITEQFAGGAVVSMEFEFEFRAECPFAVPTGVHT